MRTADLVCGACLLAAALVVVVEGVRLGIGWSTDGPLPGFFVFYLGLALLASALVIVLGALRRRADTRRFLDPAQLRPVATVLLPAVGVVALSHVLGLYVSGALYLGTYMRWIGRHRWATTVLVALGVPLVAFLVFEVWFLVPLPKGPLETRLGY